MSTTGAFKVVQDALTSYSEDWKVDHEAAMECRDLEDWLYVGNGIFDAVTKFDETHQRRVFAGEIEYDPEHSDLIKQAYRCWLVPCDSLTAKIESVRKLGFQVENSEQFLSNCREAKGILTDDATFFSDEAMVMLRDEAIDEHRAGESLECGGRQ